MELNANENLIKQGKATYYRGMLDSLGGSLYLTDRRIVFEAHRFNFGGKKQLELFLNQITECRLGFVGVSGTIEVVDMSKNFYKFVVFGRKDWADKIMKQSTIAKTKLLEKFTSNNWDNEFEAIKELKSLLDLGIITVDEYNAMKAELLKNI